MKKIYWNSHRFSRLTLLFVCLLAISGFIVVEKYKTSVPQNFYSQKLAATLAMQQAMTIIKNERSKKNIPLHQETDPQRSGLIGQTFNYLTTGHSNLSAKQTTINPNFAALIINWLKKVNISRGDTIAIGMNGSYPALNIAVLAAVKTLDLKPIIIISTSVTQWGANIPGLLWVDMQSILYKKHLFNYLPAAATVSATSELTAKAKADLTKTITNYHIPIIDAKDSLEAIDKRMQIYAEKAQNASIKAYINIGGATTLYKQLHAKHKALKPGLNISIPIAAASGDSVMLRFMKSGIPAINLTKIELIAEENDLPIAPLIRPPVGQGKIFFGEIYNAYLTFSFLIAIIGLLIITTMLNKARFNRHYNSGVKKSNADA